MSSHQYKKDSRCAAPPNSGFCDRIEVYATNTEGIYDLTEKAKVLVIMLFAVISVSVGETLLAKGMKASTSVTGSVWTQFMGVLNRHTLTGSMLMMFFFWLYAYSLRRADLSFVLPITALSYLLGALLAKHYLGETVTATRWLGVAIITVGVIVVGLGESSGQKIP